MPPPHLLPRLLFFLFPLLPEGHTENFSCPSAPPELRAALREPADDVAERNAWAADARIPTSTPTRANCLHQEALPPSRSPPGWSMSSSSTSHCRSGSASLPTEGARPLCRSTCWLRSSAETMGSSCLYAIHSSGFLGAVLPETCG